MANTSASTRIGPLDLANGLPSTREELFRYQGMILGSADASVFTAEQQRMLADFVTVRGGALLALGGEQSFGEGGWLETPLSYLLPIAFDPNRTRQSPRRSVKVNVWPRGDGVDHPAVAELRATRTPALKMWRSCRQSRSSTLSIRVQAPRYFCPERIATVASRWCWLFNNTAQAARWFLPPRTRGCG